MTNAVFHRSPDVAMTRIGLQPGLRVAVHDCGNTIASSATSQVEPTQLTGRGLAIVASLACCWGVDVFEPLPGKTVWFAVT